MENKETIRVEEILVKRFKKLEDFSQSFGGQSVIIMGPNEAGKTTLQQFLRALMGDDEATPPGSFPEGEIKIKKGDKEYTIRGEIKGGKKKIVVCSNGMEDSRKEALHSLIGALKFNVFEFVEKSKTKAGRKEQVEDIKKLLPEDIQKNLAIYEADVAAKYEERTGLNKDLKNADGSIKTHPLYHLNEGQLRALKGVDVSAVFTELNQANEQNAKIAKGQQKRDDLFAEIITDEEKLAALMAKIKADKEKLAVADKWLAENKPVDTSALSSTIEQSQKTNEEFNRAQELIGLYEKKAKLEENVGQLTVDIEQGREMISEAVKEMCHVVEGLAWNDEGLTLNGIPVHPNSLSMSQIMRLAYQIKNYENPCAPLFVDNLESFDQAKYDALLAFAKENDLQIIGQEVKRDAKGLEFHIIPV